MTRTVYRLETPEGVGPYNLPRPLGDPDLAPSFIDIEYHGITPDPHPSPFEDDLDYVDEDEFFGFTSREQLNAWFFREAKDAWALEQMGLYVVIYHVGEDLVREGQRQALFVRDEATQVALYTPTSWAKLEQLGVQHAAVPPTPTD